VWFVPILNLIRGYGMMWECWTAGDPVARAQVRSRSYRRSQGRLVPLWLATFVVGVLGFGGEFRVNQWHWEVPGAVQLVLLLTAIVVAVVLVRTVTRPSSSGPDRRRMIR
jgi:uncharacterized membrane protein YeaQ/YmgE (transglycosylase-associated protein family)